MDWLWDAVGTLAAPVLGFFGANNSAQSSADSQAKTNQASQDSAREQMAFQERMSNSAHQREVKDLELAGLNPILSANAGASTPAGAMGSFQNPNPPQNSQFAVSSAMQAAQTMADVMTKAATAKAANAQADNTAQNTKINKPKEKGANLLSQLMTSSAKAVDEAVSKIKLSYQSDYDKSQMA